MFLNLLPFSKPKTIETTAEPSKTDVIGPQTIVSQPMAPRLAFTLSYLGEALKRLLEPFAPVPLRPPHDLYRGNVALWFEDNYNIPGMWRPEFDLDAEPDGNPSETQEVEANVRE